METSLAQRVRDFGHQRYQRLIGYARQVKGMGLGWAENRRRRREGPVGIDPRISYPCSKSLDEHIDLERLIGLDGFLTDQVRRYLDERRGVLFYTGTLKKGLLEKSRPGSRVISLTVSRKSKGFDYLDLDDPDLWKPGPAAEDFGPLMDFIATLPFQRTARMMIMCDASGHAVTGHRDHPRIEVCHEFIWFRTNLDKPFWVQDVRAERPKHYLTSYSAWFDTVNQFHGADPVDRLSISVRVDGRFTEEFRARIPPAPSNPASRAALWAALAGDGREPAGVR